MDEICRVPKLLQASHTFTAARNFFPHCLAKTASIVSRMEALTPVVLALAIILTAAKLGGDVAERIGQPAVLGELVVGVLVGNLSLLGVGWFQFITANATIAVLAQLGAVILLFEVGLESTVRDMMQVGLRSLSVAVLGVVTPWALGWWVSAVLMPEHSVYVDYRPCPEGFGARPVAGSAHHSGRGCNR